MALHPGQILSGRYRIVKHLAEGGMGAVYRAWDLRLNMSIALKEMVPLAGQNPDILSKLREQFSQEAMILAKLNHPHLVRVGDFFQENNNSYLVMDYVDGENLAERIQIEGAIPEEQMVEWTKQLLDALIYCHQNGVIHRDIKPQNVIIRSDGQAILVDFGLVKLWNPEDPRTKTVMRGMGTPEYAPPEQYDTTMGHTDSRSDIYSLGACVYHALTDQAPPTATQRIAGLRTFHPPRKLNHRISKRVERVIVRAMELQVDHRFDDASSMLNALSGKAVKTQNKASSNSQTHTKVMPHQELVLSDAVAVEVSNPVSSAEVRPVQSPDDGKNRFPRRIIWAKGVGGFVLILSLFGGFWLIGQYIKTEQNTFPTLTQIVPVPTQIVDEVLATLAPAAKATAIEHATVTRESEKVVISSRSVRDIDGMMMVYVPTDTFAMGNADGFNDERPVHDVELDDFWLDQTEVTNAQYELCTKARQCATPPFIDDQDYNAPQQPVVGITWFDASDYCQWAGGRLPTEAEWEYGARGKEGYIYPWGNEYRENATNCAERTCQDDYSFMAPVGSFAMDQSWVGAFDMAGNVEEWIADWYGDYSPIEQRNPLGPSDGTKRVVRGGRWDADFAFLRLTRRGKIAPSYGNEYRGFRCVNPVNP